MHNLFKRLKRHYAKQGLYLKKTRGKGWNYNTQTYHLINDSSFVEAACDDLIPWAKEEGLC